MKKVGRGGEGVEGVPPRRAQLPPRPHAPPPQRAPPHAPSPWCSPEYGVWFIAVEDSRFRIVEGCFTDQGCLRLVQGVVGLTTRVGEVLGSGSSGEGGRAKGLRVYRLGVRRRRFDRARLQLRDHSRVRHLHGAHLVHGERFRVRFMVQEFTVYGAGVHGRWFRCSGCSDQSG